MTHHKPKSSRRKFSNRPLESLSKLKKTLKKQEKTKKESSQKPTQVPTDKEDENIFSKAMAGVAPLHPNQPNPKPTSVLMRPVQSPSFQEDQEEREVMQALQDLVEGESPLCIYETEETIEGAVEGLDSRILRKLRKGEFSIQDHLDLHGFTRDEARDQVESFLLTATAQGKRCVLIIHGRGHGSKDQIPVLKNALRNWLTRRALRKKVLAFTTARPYDGGAGAVYVLLKKHWRRNLS